MGIFATEDRDEKLKTIWESMVLQEYLMGDYHEEVVSCEAYLVTLIDRCYFLCFLVNAGP